MSAHSTNAHPSRPGVQRLIPRWEYRHLRAYAYARMGSGVVLTACGLVTLSLGGNVRKTYGWASVFMFFAALTFAAGYWELTVARSASRRTLTWTSTD